MNIVAIKMLTGDRAKYIGIILGLTFASLLITQQAAIFIGIMVRTFGTISDVGIPDIWVMDPKVQFIDDIKPLQETELYRVRGIEGVAWAMPLYRGMLKAKLANGTFQTCIVMGIDDATLVGGPPTMVEGNIADLRQSDAVIVDEVGAADKLATPTANPDVKIPLRIGDRLELNDRRAVVVGICKVSRTFQNQPVVYTTYSRAMTFAPRERRLLSFILVKAKPGQDFDAVTKRITAATGLGAYTAEQFKEKTVTYFIKYTGIPINFGIVVILGFFIGIAIAGQTFYNFTMDNIRHFGALKAMGAQNGLLLKMILLQSLLAGTIGYGLGVGAAAVIGFFIRKSQIAFLLPWQLMVVTAIAILMICAVSAAISIIKVIRLEPAIVFKS